jgi:hypothetical protein
MSDLLHIVSAQPVVHGLLKIVWDDQYEGVVDLRPIIARGKIFTHLESKTNFKKVQVAEYGHSIFWINDAGCEIDFGCDRLREMAEEQAAWTDRDT